MTPFRRWSLAGLAALMAGSAMIHLLKPEIYTKIVPKWAGNAEFHVLWTGLAELTCAGLLLVPRTRRFGALFTAGLLIVVFPANVKMALDGADPNGGWFTGSDLSLWLRLPLQPLLIWWALSFRNGATAPKPTT